MTLALTFYDSTNLDDIPRQARNVFAYIDGLYANYREALGRWPLVVPITIGTPGPDALRAAIIDSEAGDADPDRTAQWCQAKLDNHMVPTVYRSAALWRPVDEALTRLGLHYGIGPGKVQRFSALYDGNPAIIPGDVAKQYLPGHGESNGPTNPGHYDTSSALTYVPGWGMGAPLSRRHRRYAEALAKAWGARDRRLTHDRFLVELLERNATRLLDIQ